MQLEEPRADILVAALVCFMRADRQGPSLSTA